MTTAPPPPICGSANSRHPDDRRQPVYATAERYVQSLMKMGDCIPVLMPPVGGAVDAVELVSRMDGFLLAGGLANVEPHHYDGPAFPPDEPIDPGRDALVLPLVRACIAERVPVFGICRGIQEISYILSA